MSVKFDDLKKSFWITEYNFNEEGIKKAIIRAIGDFTFRTEKRRNPKQSFGKAEMFEILDENGFVEIFIDYFKRDPMNQEQFDRWHHDMCETFLDALKDVYDNLAYGKAQKIVNMTFKNAYCLEKVDNEVKLNNGEEYYQYCHMPLDSFTLEWFKRKIVKKNKISIRDGEKNLVSLIPNWSKLSYKKQDDKDQYCYSEIIDAIRTYFASPNQTDSLYLKNQTPLKAEFYIWKYIQFEMAAEEIYKLMIDVNDENRIEDFKEKTVNQKLEYLHNMFNDVDKYKIEEEK